MTQSRIIIRLKQKLQLINLYSKKREGIILLLKNNYAYNDLEFFNKKSLLSKLPRNSAITRYRNFCSINARLNSVNRVYGLCRHMVRKSMSEALLPGLVKSSW